MTAPAREKTARRRPRVTVHPEAAWAAGRYAALAALCVLCYGNSLRGELVHDDVWAIVNNPDVRPGSGLRNIFSNDFWGKRMADNTSHKSYRPLCILTFNSVTIIKFADDTAIVGCITDNDEAACREEVEALTSWCKANNLLLNVSKTKELIGDYGRLRRGGHGPVHIEGAAVERESAASGSWGSTSAGNATLTSSSGQRDGVSSSCGHPRTAEGGKISSTHRQVRAAAHPGHVTPATWVLNRLRSFRLGDGSGASAPEPAGTETLSTHEPSHF